MTRAELEADFVHVPEITPFQRFVAVSAIVLLLALLWIAFVAIPGWLARWL